MMWKLLWVILYNLMKQEKRFSKYSAKNWNPEKLKIGFMPAHPAIFFKRDVFEKYGKLSFRFYDWSRLRVNNAFFLETQVSHGNFLILQLLPC